MFQPWNEQRLSEAGDMIMKIEPTDTPGQPNNTETSLYTYLDGRVHEAIGSRDIYKTRVISVINSFF